MIYITLPHNLTSVLSEYRSQLPILRGVEVTNRFLQRLAQIPHPKQNEPFDPNNLKQYEWDFETRGTTHLDCVENAFFLALLVDPDLGVSHEQASASDRAKLKGVALALIKGLDGTLPTDEEWDKLTEVEDAESGRDMSNTEQAAWGAAMGAMVGVNFVMDAAAASWVGKTNPNWGAGLFAPDNAVQAFVSGAVDWVVGLFRRTSGNVDQRLASAQWLMDLMDLPWDPHSPIGMHCLQAVRGNAASIAGIEAWQRSNFVPEATQRKTKATLERINRLRQLTAAL